MGEPHVPRPLEVCYPGRVNWADVVAEISVVGATVPNAFNIDISRLAGPSSPPIVAIALELLQDTTDAKTLGDLVNLPDAEEILRDGLDRGERRVFLRSLGELVRKFARKAEAQTTAIAPLSGHDPERVPEGGAALEEWARHFGVLDILNSPVALRDPDRRRNVQMKLRAWVDLETYPHTGEEFGYPRLQLRRNAEQRLRTHAARNVPLLARRAAFLARRRAPDNPWIAARIQLLSDALRQRTPHEGKALPDVPLSMRYPIAEAAFHPLPPSLHVQIGLGRHAVDLERSAVTNMGHSWIGSQERVREDCAILMAAVDALSDPEGKAQSDLLAWHNTPAWRHMLDAFERGLPREERVEPDAEERIAFRLCANGSDSPSVLLQRARKGGSFTAGRQEDPSAALGKRGLKLTPLEREVLEILGAGRNSYGIRRDRLRLRLLELLADHPRVFVEGDVKRLVRMRRIRPSLRVVAVASQFRVELSLEETAISPAEAVANSREGLLTVYTPSDHTVRFSPLDAVTTTLLGALASHPQMLPTDGLDALLGILHAFPSLAVDLDLPEEARGTCIPSDTRLVVQLAMAPDGSLAVAVRVRALAGVATTLPGIAPRHVYGSVDGKRVFVTRDLDDEHFRAEQLLAALPLGSAVHKGPFDLRVQDADRACDLVATLAELGSAVVLEWPEGEGIRVTSTATAKALRLRVERRNDWFGIGGGIEVDGMTVGLRAMLEAVRAGRRFVPLKGGALVALSRDLRARLLRADDVLHENHGQLAAHGPSLEAVSALVEDESTQISADRAWLELRARIRTAATVEPKLPRGLRATLRPYQLDGFRWLMRLAACGAGGCLADDMGLGKTIQSLAVLLARKAEGPAIVLAPMSVCANWLAEAERFAPSLTVVNYRGTDRRAALDRLGPGSVLVVSYDLLHRDIDAIAPLSFASLIADEAHALKNSQSRRAAAACRIQADFRVALTGTPVENHLGELWSLFRVVTPGLFGSWERFRERFAGPIERDRDLARSKALAQVVRPYLLRRVKADVAPELPPRTEVVRTVELSKAERELYELERQRALELAAGARELGGEDPRFAIFAALTRLRQLACHPRLRHPESSVPSSKLASVLELVDELRETGHRALVFSQFTSHLALVADALKTREIRFFELDGSTPAEARADRVRRFQNGEADLFLISLKAGGVGLNLTAADYVLHLDPWWNPAAEDQASDRAHRIGQDKPVTVVRFISHATIEEAVLALHANKRELADAVLAGGDSAGRLSTRELMALMAQSTGPDETPEADP